jgi:hypothetical protein
MVTKRKPQQTQLKEIANIPETVEAFGRKYKIAKFNLRQLSQLMEYAGYLGVLIIQAMKLKPNPTAEDLVNFLTQGIGVSSPAVIPVISIATKEPVQWLEEQDDLVGALEIFVKAVEKNRSFFTPANIQRVKGIFAGLLPETKETGTDTSTT